MSLDSAIPPHLREPRVCASSLPDGCRPSFAARTASDVRHVVMAFMGPKGTPGSVISMPICPPRTVHGTTTVPSPPGGTAARRRR